MHYWVGSLCRNMDNKQGVPLFPGGVTAISDVIKLVANNGNQIPDKSWMLYLLEFFNIRNIPIELNLICQFDNQDYFEAIFQGINKYRFKKVLPVVGHSYMRIIMMDKVNKRIRYTITDQKTIQSEDFDLSLNGMDFDYVGANQFTGIEWWNKIGSIPYQIKYKVEVSQLMFGLSDKNDPQSIIFLPHNSLIPNKDDSGMNYPISFQNIMLKDGCVCYSIESGNCINGIHCNLKGTI